MYNVMGGIYEVPDLLFKSLVWKSKGNMDKIVPYKFSMDETFSNTFPDWLADQGITNPKSRSSNYSDCGIDLYDDY
jgi:hypothetical protein